MHILILGATGTFGSALTAHLLRNTHHRLTLLARHASDAYHATDRTRVINGDAAEPTVLSVAADGTDAVVCAVSGPVLPCVAQNLVQTLPRTSVKYLIFLGAVGIYHPRRKTRSFRRGI